MFPSFARSGVLRFAGLIGLLMLSALVMPSMAPASPALVKSSTTSYRPAIGSPHPVATPAVLHLEIGCTGLGKSYTALLSDPHLSRYVEALLAADARYGLTLEPKVVKLQLDALVDYFDWHPYLYQSFEYDEPALCLGRPTGPEPSKYRRLTVRYASGHWV